MILSIVERAFRCFFIRQNLDCSLPCLEENCKFIKRFLTNCCHISNLFELTLFRKGGKGWSTDLAKKCETFSQ